MNAKRRVFRRPGFRLPTWTIFAVVILCVATAAWAALQYKDDTAPGGVPDFWQKPGKGNCWEVAVANCLWYFDHHGYAGLFPHSNGDPGNWQQDSQAVIGKLEGPPRSYKNAEKLLEMAGKNWVEGKRAGLHVETYFGNPATYSLYLAEISRSQDVIPGFKAHKTGTPDGTWLTVPPDNHEWRHSQTGAAWDNANPPTQIATTNGWSNKNGAQADNPNVVERANYDTHPIQNPNTSGDKLRITAGGPVPGIPPAGSDYIEMTELTTVCPIPKDGPARALVGNVQPKPGAPPKEEYSYTVENLTDASGVNEPVMAFGIEIDVPFTFTDLNVQSPSGWSAQEWFPSATPGLAPRPPFLDPDDFSHTDSSTPQWRGILWTASSSLYAVAPGSSLSGFSFELPVGFTHSDEGSYVAMSSTTIDADRILSHGVTLGPVPGTVPTLGGWGMAILVTILLLTSLWLLRRRQRVIF